MRDKFFEQKNCSRCGCSLDGKAFTMSRFNTDKICLKCEATEQQHPDYKKAADAELEAVKHGDYNFPGVGWPGKNGRLK